MSNNNETNTKPKKDTHEELNSDEYVKLGLTSVTLEFLGTPSKTFPYDTDFVYDKNIFFRTSPDSLKYKALYIMRPKKFTMTQQGGVQNWDFLIAGYALNSQGLAVFRMGSVTIVP
ncbi:hypothetical protein [Sphingobacterium suaedae]|uniref:Uncharacterized protein n=1 Tax=Sphingobacterium suaedae TaxID=1686402 RepID=A0ABW5KFA0_9SPHI